MSTYRVYFRTAGKIHGRDDFEAYNDVAAIRIACVLYDICSDTCDSFELWKGSRLIRFGRPHDKARLADLIEAHQQAVIESEERISQSRWMVAQSRRLLATLEVSKLAAALRPPRSDPTPPVDRANH